jgi:hypothetical protein
MTGNRNVNLFGFWKNRPKPTETERVRYSTYLPVGAIPFFMKIKDIAHYTPAITECYVVPRAVSAIMHPPVPDSVQLILRKLRNRKK